MDRYHCYVTVEYVSGENEAFNDSHLEVTGGGALIVTTKSNAQDEYDDVSTIIPPHRYVRAVASNQN